MGEIDTKPIESVQVALSLFGERGDHQFKHRSNTNDMSEMEKEKDVEGLEKELASYRLQLEAKDCAYMQALLQLEHYKKTAEELTALLQDCELERERYGEECNEVQTRVGELESKMKGMVDQLSETAKLREQLSHVLNELKATQADLLNMETELAAAKDSELKAMTRVELMETSANMEKEKSEELLVHISDLHNAVLISKLAATKAEEEKCRVVSEKDAEIESLKATEFRREEQLEDVRKQLEAREEVENQLLAKSTYIDALQAQLEQVTNVLGSMENATLDGEIDLNQIKQELEFKERKISDQAFYIEALETEVNRLKHELENYQHSKSLAQESKQLTPESGNGKTEVELLKKELEAAMVKVGLFRNRAEQAATRAEAAEKAKAKLEGQLRGWQEQKQRRKAALAALREESAPKQFSPPSIEKLPNKHQPLGQVLNIKF